MAEAAAEPEAGFPASDTFVETMSQMIADAGTPGDHLNIVPEIITGLVGCAVGAVIVLCCWWRCVGSDNIDREHLVLPACLEMIPCLRSRGGPRRQGTAMGPPQQLAEMLASLTGSEPSSSGGSTRERVESGGISALHSPRAVSSSRDACSAHRRPQDDIDCVNFQELIVTSVKKGAQLFGPKFSKSKVLHKVVQERVSKLPDRAKAFMIEEMNSTAKEVLQAVHEPEPGMVVDWTSAVMEGMPSPIALLAGVVSPMVLKILYIAHIVQCVFVASLMVLSACVAAHDWNTSCPAVSSIYYWSYSQGILAFLLLACRLHLIGAIRKGTGTIRGKSQEHADRVDDLDAAPNQMIDFMRSHVVLFQEWLVVEQEVLHSLWQHSVGFFTLLWLICVLWDAVLVLGWTGVPGKIAYRGVNSEETDANFCDAKLTVFAAHFSLLLNMMFFFVTLTALLFWFVTSFTFSTRGTHHVIDAARRFDRENVLAIPLMEVCAKSLVLRGMTELPSVQVAIAAQKKARLDAELALLKQQVLKVESKIQEQSGVLMFYGAESALHVAPTSIDEQAAQLVETTLEDLERLVHWLYDLMLHVEHSESVQRVVHEASLISAESAAWAREHVAEMRVSMNESQAVQRTLAQAHDLAGKGAVWARHALQEAKSEAQESEVVMRALAKARAMAQRAEHAMQEVEESQTMTRAMIQAHAMAQRAEHAMQEVQESQTMTRAMIQAESRAHRHLEAESRAHRHLEAEANGVQNHG